MKLVYEKRDESLDAEDGSALRIKWSSSSVKAINEDVFSVNSIKWVDPPLTARTEKRG